MCAARSSGRVHQQLQAAQNVQACMLCAGHRFLWPTLTALHGCSVSRAVPPHRVRQCSRPRAHGRPWRCCWRAAGRSHHRHVAWSSCSSSRSDSQPRQSRRACCYSRVARKLPPLQTLQTRRMVACGALHVWFVLSTAACMLRASTCRTARVQQQWCVAWRWSRRSRGVSSGAAQLGCACAAPRRRLRPQSHLVRTRSRAASGVSVCVRRHCSPIVAQGACCSPHEAATWLAMVRACQHSCARSVRSWRRWHATAPTRATRVHSWEVASCCPASCTRPALGTRACYLSLRCREWNGCLARRRLAHGICIAALRQRH